MTEPSPLLINFILTGLPFLAYFSGIIIRKVALPGKNSPPLLHQILLGVPISLIVVSPLIVILNKSFTTDISTYLVTLGIIMEHGMIVNETAVKHLNKMRGAA